MMFFVHLLSFLDYILSRQYGSMFLVAGACAGLVYLAGITINGKGAVEDD